MRVIGLARIGRDVELRDTGSDSVINLALAFQYGKKADGEKYRPTQWVDAALWGKRAEALSEYLQKGDMVNVILRDVHIEEYEGRNGKGTKLVGTVMEIDLIPQGERQREEQPREPQRQQRSSSAPSRAPTRGGGSARQAAGLSTGGASGFDDMDDDIPFVTSSFEYDTRPRSVRKMAKYHF